jgi:ribosomal protein S18 acetylase RimI-like enzyme
MCAEGYAERRCFLWLLVGRKFLSGETVGQFALLMRIIGVTQQTSISGEKNMVELIPMTEDEFQMFLAYSIQNYAHEHVTGGIWSEEEALQKATDEFQGYLPQGLNTPGHYLTMVVDDALEKSVGILWFAVSEKVGQQQAFVYDIEIFQEYRRQGYGTLAFRELENRARELGVSSIALHVFGHNFGARNLYEKLGYVATNIQMVKKLPAAQETQA